MAATLLNIYTEPAKTRWPELGTRPAFDSSSLEVAVKSILEEVKEAGDAAVQKFNAQFDGNNAADFLVPATKIAASEQLIAGELRAAILLAKNNIERFHTAQKEPVIKLETAPGVFCWRESVGIESVGLYIPGGTAPLFSTLLMLAIPALIAGCNNIVVCTPAQKNGEVHPAILYTAKVLGLEKLYAIGGVQAIAAMSYGTTSVPRVSKIFGPGNQYVTCAKQIVSQQGTAIDMPAGPSELAVYADESCIPAFVAADLLSQAEHGKDSQVVLVASNPGIVTDVEMALQAQIATLPRGDIARAAMEYSRAVVIADPHTAFDFLNDYAPEHLIIASENAAGLSRFVVNAGSVFIGNYSPESAGDYASGTNHTLPTNGYAKMYSGVSVDSFVKKITFQELTGNGLQTIGKAVETMAAAEGLEAHKNAVTLRLKYLDNGN
ncbi:MAG: histidinol dehydrogenase [Ferruginibacter sp.]|nr:histidinol dehydrogenase [Ferruginibacter sp.]